MNWCPALGTVLANEEVVDGVSERGGHPVIRKVRCSIYYLIVHFFLQNIYAHRFATFLIFIVVWFYDFTVHCLLPSSLCGNGC